MENGDREKILLAAQRNAQLKRLYREHVAFEEQLERFSKRPFLTAEEQESVVRLKRRKLRGVDMMMALVSHESDSDGINGAARVGRKGRGAGTRESDKAIVETKFLVDGSEARVH